MNHTSDNSINTVTTDEPIITSDTTPIPKKDISHSVKFKVSFVVGVFLLVSAFQNCSQTRFHSQKSETQSSK